MRRGVDARAGCQLHALAHDNQPQGWQMTIDENEDLNTLIERAQQLTLPLSVDSEGSAIQRQTTLLVEVGIAIAVRLDRIARALEAHPVRAT